MMAFTNIYKILADHHRVRSKEGLWFAIHMRDKVMDRIGKGTNDQFMNIWYNKVLQYVKYDVYRIDIFV